MIVWWRWHLGCRVRVRDRVRVSYGGPFSNNTFTTKRNKWSLGRSRLSTRVISTSTSRQGTWAAEADLQQHTSSTQSPCPCACIALYVARRRHYDRRPCPWYFLAHPVRNKWSYYNSPNCPIRNSKSANPNLNASFWWKGKGCAVGKTVSKSMQLLIQNFVKRLNISICFSLFYCFHFLFSFPPSTFSSLFFGGLNFFFRNLSNFMGHLVHFGAFLWKHCICSREIKPVCQKYQRRCLM